MPGAAGWKGLLAALAALILLGVQSSAHAAKPATPYATGVQDEVMMQNLTCDDLQIFLNKPLGYTMDIPATQILNQPQHAKETSETLFGALLTRLILAASNYPNADHPPNPSPDFPNMIGSATPCTRFVPMTAPPDVGACDGRTYVPPPMPGLPGINPGELKLLGMFDHAAKFKNCRR